MTSADGRLGLVAILRGLTPEEAPAVGEVLVDAGFRTLEVPLNSSAALRSIRLLRDRLPAEVIVGAGTVLRVEEVAAVRDAGGELIVSPDTDPAVIAETVRLGLLSLPGVATVSEAKTALAAGASGLKLFPAGQVGVDGLRAWAAVLPTGVELLPVGGLEEAAFGAWIAAGATGFGVGSALYRPGSTLDEIGARARRMQAAWRRAREDHA